MTNHLHNRGVEPITQNNPNMRRVEPVVGVENRGGIPGTVILEVLLTPASPFEVMQVTHQW